MECQTKLFDLEDLTHNIILTPETDLGELFGDDFRKITVENPYHTMDYENAKQMNRIENIDSVIEPVGFDKSPGNIARLRGFVENMLEIHEQTPLTENNIDSVLKILSKKFKHMYKKSYIFYMYSLICKERDIELDDNIRFLFQVNSMRSQSGVMVYAVFTHPFFKYNSDGKLESAKPGEKIGKTFSCKFDCAYCPDMPTYPRSYVPGEPGNDRAHTLNYDTIKQIQTRATAYKNTGHTNAKAEVIILGGTWHSYDLEYRIMFMTLVYYAFNTLYDDRANPRPILSLEDEMKINETAICGVIGVTIETRPDQITPKSIIDLRKMGVTRVQLGVQHTNIRLLNRVQRRCTPQDAVNAIRLLKDFGFKVDIHVMPDLPKPYTLEFEEQHKKLISKGIAVKHTKDDIDWNFDSVYEDAKMFEKILHGPKYKPDQIKIYPCAVMDWTRIKEDFENGTHIPYGSNDHAINETNKLVELLIRVKSNFPEECRINRLIRDIPEGYIMGGIRSANGREYIAKIMENKGLKCSCIRCREIKKKKINHNNDNIFLRVTHYEASKGDEYFLQYVTKSNELIGFLRLRVSKTSGYHITYRKDKTIRSKKLTLSSLTNSAMIRELHVYGETIGINNKSSKMKSTRTHQHAGYGTRLLYNAYVLASMLGYSRVSVISGVGVKEYYRNKHGFVDGEYYLFKDLDDSINEYIKQHNIPIEVSDDMIEHIKYEKNIYTQHYQNSDDDANQVIQYDQNLNQYYTLSYVSPNILLGMIIISMIVIVFSYWAYIFIYP